MKFASVLIVLASLIIAFIYLFTGYQSAFEADQACHAFMSNEPYVKSTVGCDHDLETRQWIFYEKTNSFTAAKVIKRFKY